VFKLTKGSIHSEKVLIIQVCNQFKIS